MKSVTLRPRFGMVLTGIVALMAVLALFSFVAVGDPLGAVLHGWGLILLAYACWLAFWAPAVVITEDAVVVENPFRRHRIPWPAIQRVDTRWSLRLFTKGRAVTAWSAPAPSRYALSRMSRPEMKGLPESTYGPGNSIGLGDVPSSESGLAAYHVRRRFEDLRDAGRLTGTDAATSTWRIARIAITIALLAATVASFFLP